MCFNANLRQVSHKEECNAGNKTNVIVHQRGEPTERVAKKESKKEKKEIVRRHSLRGKIIKGELFPRLDRYTGRKARGVAWRGMAQPRETSPTVHTSGLTQTRARIRSTRTSGKRTPSLVKTRQSLARKGGEKKKEEAVATSAFNFYALVVPLFHTCSRYRPQFLPSTAVSRPKETRDIIAE